MLMKRRPLISAANMALALLLAINLFNYIDRQVLAAVVPEIQKAFRISDFQVGLLQPAFLVSYMIIAPLFGWLGDRYRRWTLVGIGVVIWSLASGASGLAFSFGMLLATRVFVGFGEAAYGPTAPTLISDMYPVEDRGRVMAWFYAAIPVGSALGYVLGSAVLNADFIEQSERWHWAFLVVVPPGLLMGVLCFLKRDPPRGAVDPGAAVARKATLGDYKVFLKTPSYLWNTAGMAAMTFALGGIGFWMPKYIVWRHAMDGELNVHDLAAETAALATANKYFGPIIVVSGLFGTLIGGTIGDRLRSKLPGSYFIVSGAAMSLAFPLFLLLPFTPFPAVWGLTFVTSFCLFFNTGPTNTILANVTHPAIRSAAFALNIFVIHVLGDAISPPLIGLVNDLFGKPSDVYGENMNAGFIAISMSILIAAACWLAGAKHLGRDTAAAPTRLSGGREGVGRV